MAFDRQNLDRTIAAITVYCEASSATQPELECVAHVIQNRVRDPRGRWSKTPAGVCTDYMQFSSWNGDANDRRNLLRAINAVQTDTVMDQAFAAWDAVASGDTDDPTKGATHYHDKSIAPPSWTQGATMTLETANFMFYANVR